MVVVVVVKFRKIDRWWEIIECVMMCCSVVMKLVNVREWCFEYHYSWYTTLVLLMHFRKIDSGVSW